MATMIEFDDDERDETDETGADGVEVDAIDAEFEDVKRPAPAVQEDTGDEEPPIIAEVVGEESPLDRFFKDLPSESGTVSIVLHRKADPHNVAFRIPNTTRIHIGTLIWSGETPGELHGNVQHTEGGGLYEFQLRYGKGFSERKWDKLIADPAEPSVRERTLRNDPPAEVERREEQPSVSQPAPGPVKSALSELKERLQEAEELRSLLNPNGNNDRVEVADAELNVQDQLKLKIFDRLADRPEFADKLTNLAFGVFEKDAKKEKETWVDVAKEAIKSPGQVMQLISGFVNIASGLLGRGGPAPAALPVRSMVQPPPGRPVTQTGIVMPPAADIPPAEPAAAPAVAPAAVVQDVVW